MDEKTKNQLYNRLDYVVGAETRKSYGELRVLLVGLTGTGLEVAKNLALTGVKSISLLDNSPIQASDLSSLFYATEADIGKPRAATLESRIQPLNRFCTIQTINYAPADASAPVVSEEVLNGHQVVIFVDHCTSLLVRENEMCRKLGVRFVACESRGLACSVFVDAGDNFKILDKNGEPTPSCIVTAIDNDGVIMIHEDKTHETEVGDMVFFTNIEGPTILNSESKENPKLFEVLNPIGPFALKVKLPDDFDKQPEYGNNGGYLHTTKQPKPMPFLPLKESLANPEMTFIDDDASKLTSGSQLHSLFQAIHAKLGSANPSVEALSRLASDDATQSDLVAQAKTNDADIDENFARTVVATFNGNLNPMACFVGGIAAQEVLKIGSGKFTPIKQWFYYDVREIVPELPSAADRTASGSRYDGQIAVIGRKANDELIRKSAFIVGAGALGCEFAKNVACLGIGCGGEDSHVSITDMDTIELSNLSRQFLFRNEHIGDHKAKVAGQAAMNINPSLRVDAKTLKVAQDTENVFNDDFWTSKHMIINALDNVAARRYVDERCVFFCLPLFESGTLGTKANAQTIIPRLTENYTSAITDPPEKSIPLCTLTNTPNSIEHTIQWARDHFFGVFNNAPRDANSYLHETDSFFAALKKDPSNRQGTFRKLIETVSMIPSTPQECVVWARKQFDEWFNLMIKQLLHSIPVDMVTPEGLPYWGGAKRPPKPIDFNAKDDHHMAFIRAASILFAEVHGLRPAVQSLSLDEMAQVAGSMPPPTFTPKVMKFAMSNEDKDGNVMVGAVDLTENDLPSRETYKAKQFNALEFEKDDDTNFHIEFVTATSNLRAINYQIPPSDNHQTKMIAGRIIPAMITTTALITGVVGFELLKFSQGISDREKYRNTYFNIGVSLMAVSVPQPSPKASSYTTSDGREIVFTMWDRLEVGDKNKDILLKELIAEFKQRYDLDVSMITTAGGRMLFNAFTTKAERLNMPVTKVLETIQTAPLAPDERHVTLIVSAECNDKEVEVPSARYNFKR